MTTTDILCTWTGEAFVPRPGFHAKRANEAFGAGEMVVMNVENERSMRSHRHYFASIKEAWDNLPERHALAPWAQSPEHLRKYALIRTGYCDIITHPCATQAEAFRWAAIIRPMDEFGLVTTRDAVVTRYVAKSQSVKAMGSKEFQKSKTDVLEWLDVLLRGEAA